MTSTPDDRIPQTCLDRLRLFLATTTQPEIVTDSKSEPCATFDSRNAMRCAKCGREFGEDEGIFRGYHKRRGFFGGCSITYTWVCEACAAPSMLELADTHQFRCATCDRLMVAPRRVAFCSRSCQQISYRERLRARKAKPIYRCDTCGVEFSPKRSDARTCSPACRQKAYRQRGTGGGSD